jgi:hypothetical protein
MRKMLLAATALMGVFAISTLTASAAPVGGLANVPSVSDHNLVTNVDYNWHHHHWHHRRWDHGHWRYWD